MLDFLQSTRVLRFTRPGQLLPWMGPALRGLLARPFKESVCIHSRAQQQTRWRYCTGCPHVARCPYGQTFEPDPPAGTAPFSGQEMAARPVVLSLPFPLPPQVRPGDAYPVTLTMIGSASQAHRQRVWDALADAGGDPRRGFDPERTTFTLDRSSVQDCRELIALPAVVGSEMVDHVRVDLTTPLFLRAIQGERRRHLVAPTLADLLRATLRILGTLCKLYARPLEADFPGLKAAAYKVPCLTSAFRPFHQPHWSNRSRTARPLHGVIGHGVYGPLPRSLVDWLRWGGRVHVGTDRVAGAGGWRVASQSLIPQTPE